MDHLFADLSGFDGSRFHPAAAVRAANLLLSLRAPEAVARLQRSASPGSSVCDADNALLLARLVFDPPPQGRLPSVELGAPDVPLPRDGDLPLFPLVLHGDLPFLMIYGYTMGGQSLPISEQLEQHARSFGVRTGLAASRPQSAAAR